MVNLNVLLEGDVACLLDGVVNLLVLRGYVGVDFTVPVPLGNLDVRSFANKVSLRTDMYLQGSR